MPGQRSRSCGVPPEKAFPWQELKGNALAWPSACAAIYPTTSCAGERCAKRRTLQRNQGLRMPAQTETGTPVGAAPTIACQVCLNVSVVAQCRHQEGHRDRV